MISNNLIELKKSILNDLSTYRLEEISTKEPYSLEDIKNFEILIDQYFSNLNNISLHTNAKIMVYVDALVLALNKLNKQCDYNLIETDEREQICELILLAAKETGLHTEVSDITEELRDW